MPETYAEGPILQDATGQSMNTTLQAILAAIQALEPGLVTTSQAGKLAPDAEAIENGFIKLATVNNKGLMKPLYVTMLENPDQIVFPGSSAMSNAAYHNSIYRGKNLGSSLTAEQSAQIRAGTFKGLWLGDYWVINGHTHTIADFDPYYHCGDTSLATHHVAIVSDGGWSSKWYDTAQTTQGYVSTETGTIRKYIKDTVEPAIISDFDSAHVLSYRQLYPSAYNGQVATSWAWTDAKVELMNEVEVYGCPVWGGSAYEIGIAKRQLSIFRVKPDFMNIRASWWLRTVSTGGTGCAAYVHGYGTAHSNAATHSYGVRPLSLIA